MIKTVLFDLGNVLLPFDLMRLARALSRYSRYSPEEVLARIGADDVLHRFETGELAPEEYHAYVLSSCSINGLDFNQFVLIFNDIFDEDADVVGLLGRLKERYKLGLISNTNAIHVSHLRASYPMLGHFERMWFSNEAGCRKPDARIYEMALAHFATRPEETVFVDDMLPNVVAARNLGIRAIHYRDRDQLSADLLQLGVHAA